jgi:hypothetical protein
MSQLTEEYKYYDANWPRSFVLSIAIRVAVSIMRENGGSFRLERTVIMQEFFDEIDMSENHTPTAVSFEL